MQNSDIIACDTNLELDGKGSLNMIKLMSTGDDTDNMSLQRGFNPSLVPSLFTRPNYLAESAWLEHIPFAFWIIASLQPRIFVELGTKLGVSYFAFCQMVERLGLDTKCYAIDTWEGDEHAGFYDESVYKKVNNYNKSNYSSFSYLLKNKFDDALKYFSDKTIDVLHIDGMHTYDAVKHDFYSWLPKLSEKSVVVFHDTNVRERDFGVFKFIEELREAYPSFEFSHGYGLAVVGVGENQSDILKWLFSTQSGTTTHRIIYKIFSLLGRSCFDMFQLQKQTSIINDFKKEILDKKNIIEQLSVNFKAKDTELANALVAHNLHIKKTVDLERQLQDVTEKAAATTANRDDLLKQLEAASKDKTGLERQLQDVTEKAAATTANRDDLLKQLEAASKDKTGLERQLQDVTEKAAATTDNRDDLLKQLEATSKDKTGLKRQLQDVTEKAAATTANRDDLLKQLEAASKDKTGLERQLQELKDTIKKTQLERDNFQNTLQMETKAFQVLQNKIGERLGKDMLSLFRIIQGKRRTSKTYSVLKNELQKAEIIDKEWYSDRYKDVSKAKMDPVDHYIRHGANEGRLPNKWYVVK